MKINTTSRAGIRMFYHNRTATNNRICTGALEVSRSSKVRAVDGTTLAATTPTPTLLSPWSKAVRAVIHSCLAITRTGTCLQSWPTCFSSLFYTIDTVTVTVCSESEFRCSHRRTTILVEPG